MRLSIGPFILLTTSIAQTSASPLTSIQDLSTSILRKARQTVNLSNVFGSPTAIPGYDRIASQPVFSVTTPWGSPYLLYERSDLTESDLEFDNELEGASTKQDNTKQVALFFMDEEDAMRLRDEMLQMDQMKGVDMRITASSLAKAVAQSVNVNKGLLTGQPIDEHSGKCKGPDEGGCLRYKIVPPKRELFYAARCQGRERVGLWGQNGEEDARLMLQSVPVIGGTMAMARKTAIDKRRRDKRNAKIGEVAVVEEGVDPIRNDYKHMEGFVGVPVFHCPQMKKYNMVKGLLRNNRKKQTPLYFSYEDLVSSYEAMRSKAKDASSIPEQPEVEVYNLMDVVTSIDRDQWRVKRARELRGILGSVPVLNKITSKDGAIVEKTKTSTGLEQVVFVPNSKNTKFKQTISKVGNGKVRRMRQMGPWGKDM
mmetsp:Transcript_18498/g.27440  ORF Transcript_18498/g.27440 Transcript_18498/m.27440 type:complete len:425 (-) Transcript_18498:199-1473(-)